MKPFQSVRAGVFNNVGGAERAVEGLLNAGFTTAQITVICSDRAKEQHFREFEHQEPSGAHTKEAVAIGGVIGAALGGLTALAGAAVTGGIGLLAAGGVAAWSGGIAGGLIGAMMTRGVEKDMADYYDQALLAGKLLVAVEDDDPQRLALAADVISEAGAAPRPLAEG